MRVLVTGATGFTGGHLARYLRDRGEHVRVLVRDLRQQGPAFAALGIEAREGNLLDRDSLGLAVAGIDVVYNVAAIYRQASAGRDSYHGVNARGIGWLIEAAAAAGARRVVHCSTVGVHGDIEHPPASEDAPFRPGDEYQRTKLEGEHIAREAASQAAIDLVIARPSGIYGPGDRRLLKLFRGVARRRFLFLGAGEIFYHLTYIDDLIEGFRLCGTVPAAAGRTYILAGGEVTRLNELVQLVAEEAHVPPPSWHLPVWPFWWAGAVCEAVCVPLRIEPPIYRRRVDFFTKSRAFDISRARAELGFVPQVTLRDGIRRTLAWYREQGWL
jgi:dihydroflavonol-4-reductase